MTPSIAPFSASLGLVVMARAAVPEALFACVILSGAPSCFITNEAEGREVEGSRSCIVTRNGRKAFSREFPEAAWAVLAYSGSFDSPSPRAAGLGLAQDDTALTESQMSGAFAMAIHYQKRLLL